RRAERRDVGPRPSHRQVGAEGAEHVAAGCVLQPAEPLRPGPGQVPPVPRVQRQPRLAVVPRDLPEQPHGLELRPAHENLARPPAARRVARLRCASWDSDYQVAVVFGGEGSREGTLVYDPYTNTWHRLKPKEEPDPRSGGNMAYDAANKLHVLFGSQFDNDPV